MKTKLTTYLSLILLALTGAATLSACNTIDGLGKDIEEAGETIQK